MDMCEAVGWEGDGWGGDGAVIIEDHLVIID
jgi:hypothetical protein